MEDDIKIQKLIEERYAFPIFEKTICKEDLLLCLISDFAQKPYLQTQDQKNKEKPYSHCISDLTKKFHLQKQGKEYGKSAFIYSEELSFLNNTIEDFAKKKIKTKF